MTIPRVFRISSICAAVTLASLTTSIGASAHFGQTAEPNLSWYFVRGEDRGYQLAWVVGVDTARRTGKVFALPGLLNLEELSCDKAGPCTFVSSSFGFARLRFRGQIAPVTITGRFEHVDVRTKSYAMGEGWDVAGEVIQTSVKPSPIDPVRFSNSYQSRESGDLVGADIEIFATSAGLQGLMILYQGWGEPTGPLALDGFVRKGNVIEFQAHLAKGPASYTLTLMEGGRAVLHRVGESSDWVERLRVVPSFLSGRAR
jgi:hypothetical protein